VKNHPEMTDPQISKLLGTTKSTIQSIRDRSHWNTINLEPRDPVGLGLCTQIDLDAAVKKAAARKAKMQPPMPEGPALKPVEEQTSLNETTEEQSQKVDLDKVFANFTEGDSAE